jgi:hypothetical protein
LKLKQEFESGSSYFSFKRFVIPALNMGFDIANLRRPTQRPHHQRYPTGDVGEFSLCGFVDELGTDAPRVTGA